MRRGVTSWMYEADTESGINSHILSPMYMKNVDLCLVVIHRWTHIEKSRYGWYPLIWWRELNHTDHSQGPGREDVKRPSNSDVLVTMSLKTVLENMWEKPSGGGPDFMNAWLKHSAHGLISLISKSRWRELSLKSTGGKCVHVSSNHWRSAPPRLVAIPLTLDSNLTHWGLVQNSKSGNISWTCVRLSN